jgi:peptidoglycan/LPS O-acetylase OafA/YrhL
LRNRGHWHAKARQERSVTEGAVGQPGLPEATEAVPRLAPDSARGPRAARVPSLDGLRAVSIAAVLLGHLAGTRGFPTALTDALHDPRVDIANLGVRVFFVISGFLITGLLVSEERAAGRVSLERFYLRRTLRIFPAYFALLGVLALLDAAHVIAMPKRDFIHALTYTMNYAPGRSWYAGHLWSLAVEEQFYLVWPATILLVTTRRAQRVALAVVLLVPLIRVVEATFWPASLTMMGNTFETTADALAIGCLLALARDSLFERAWYRRAVGARWVPIVLLLVGLALGVRLRSWLLLGQTLVNVAIALAIDRAVRRPDDFPGTLLNLPLLVFAGTLSYSLYLWQQLFLDRHSDAVTAAFPLNICLVVLAALASYYLVEKPFLRLRVRLERRMDRRSLRH